MSTDYQAMAAEILRKAREKANEFSKSSTSDGSAGLDSNTDNPSSSNIIDSSSVDTHSELLLPEVSLENHGNKVIVALDSMQLGFIQACLRKYFLRHVQLIDSREHSQGINKGILMHEFLRFYYIARRAGEKVKQAQEEGITHGRKKIPELDLDDEAITDTTRKFLEYGVVYQNEFFEVIDVEQPFSIDLFEDDQLVIVWEGIRDLDIMLGNELYVYDHKTASRKDYWDELHNQLIGYAFAGGTKLLMINEIVFVKAVNEGFHRSPLTMTPHIVDLWRESTIASVKNYLAYASLDYYPPNVHSCNSGKFGCTFRDFCKADPETQKWLMKTKYKTATKWDPFTRG
jgi:hypothetical protein